MLSDTGGGMLMVTTGGGRPIREDLCPADKNMERQFPVKGIFELVR